MGCCSSKQQQQRGRRPGGRGPAGREPARARRQGAGRPEPGARAVENPQFCGAKAAEPEDGELRQRAVRAEERAKHAEGRANQANFQVEHAEVRSRTGRGGEQGALGRRERNKRMSRRVGDLVGAARGPLGRRAAACPMLVVPLATYLLAGLA